MKYFVINLIYMVFCQKKQRRLQAYIMTSIFHTKQTTLNNAITDRFAYKSLILLNSWLLLLF